MLIIVAGSRWAGKAGRAAGWRAGTFGCGDANQAAAGGEEERGGEVTSAKSASERTESGRLPATRDVQDLRTALFLLCGWAASFSEGSYWAPAWRPPHLY